MDVNAKINLIRAKVEILKLKANAYEWQCHTPKDVKEQLEESLKEIDELLSADK